jgi:large subunit ribosomal protein L5
MIPRMQQRFYEEVSPKVAEEFGITNHLARPRMTKIVLNVGMGREIEGAKLKPHVRDQVLHDLAVITGQKPVLVKARKSVSNFKVRKGYETHAMVTLRRQRMWEFFDRLFTLAVPRIKDFRGLSDRSFDPAGNYSFGVGEQGIFPEVNMANATYTHGMNVNIVFANSNPERSRFILRELGVPFRSREAA